MSNVVPLKQNGATRNGMIGKIHVARQQLALDEDTYRSLLRRVTGKESAAQLSLAELEKVLREFKRLGFAATKRRAGKRPLTDDEQTKKIRALWLNLYHLGELRDSSEEALAAYVKRMCGVQALAWLTVFHADKVIRSLRSWLSRVGWRHPSDAEVEGISLKRLRLGIDAHPARVNYFGVAAKAALIRHQYAVLQLDLGQFVPELMEAEQMDGLIEALGVKCRAAKEA